VPVLQIADEDVELVVGVAGDEVRRVAVEHDEATVAGDRGRDGAQVAGRAVDGGADEADRAALHVAHEHVLGAVAVVGREVGREAVEDDVAAVARDRDALLVVVEVGRVREAAACGDVDDRSRAGRRPGLCTRPRTEASDGEEVNPTSSRRRESMFTSGGCIA
jgi:hypothetical protein